LFSLGADISDYFNYGFTEETWAQYCDRQRRLRAENNLARLNAAHVKLKSSRFFSSYIKFYLDATNATDASRSSTNDASNESSSSYDDE
jgi:hypothetical protein